MNQFGETQFDDVVLLTQAASAATHPVRYGELLVLLSGTAREGHDHLLADLTDWENLGPYVADIIRDTPSVHWQIEAGILSGTVVCQPGGGIVQTSQGLAVDLTGLAAAAEHTHLLEDITDFDNELPVRLYPILSGTNSISWSTSGDTIAAEARLKVHGGILSGTDGLFLALGTANWHAARGDHTHDQLHDAVTLGLSDTLALELTGQQLTGEVVLDLVGGLTVLLSGVGCNFGTGPNQVARGDHTHADLHPALTVFSSPALVLTLDEENQILSGTVRRDGDPGVDRGTIGLGANGIYVDLGTTATTAAAGNHTHSVAALDADGFMSALDKQRLEAMAVVVLSGTTRTETFRVVLESDGAVLLSGTREYFYAPYAADITGWAVIGESVLGRAVVDVRRAAYADFPPDDTDSICGSERPELLSGTRLNRNLSIATWDPELAAGDVLEFHVIAAPTHRRLTVQLILER